MLAVTDNAATVIRDLTAQGAVAEGSGLRIAADAMEGSLTLSLVPEPYDGDQVLDASGARLFLDFDAALMLEDKEPRRRSGPRRLGAVRCGRTARVSIAVAGAPAPRRSRPVRGTWITLRHPRDGGSRQLVHAVCSASLPEALP